MTRRLFLSTAALATAAPKRRVGLSFGTYGLRQLPANDAVILLANTGYDAVQLCLLPGWPTDPAYFRTAARKDLAAHLRARNLQVASVMDSLPLRADPLGRGENLQRIRLAAAFAHAVDPSKTPVLDTVLGGKPKDWDLARASMLDELQQWAATAKSEDIIIGIKPHVEHAVDSPARALYLMEHLKHPNIRLIYDYSHMQLAGLTLPETLRQLLPYAASISMKDATGTPAKHDFLLPGEGETDYLAYFQLLKKLNYQGFVNVEVSALIHRKPDYDPLKAVAACYARLAPKLQRAGLR